MSFTNDPSSVRTSALWGSGPGGESRGSALWGKGGRRRQLALLAILALAAPIAAAGASNSGSGSVKPVFMQRALREAAAANPAAKFQVVVDGKKSLSTSGVSSAVDRVLKGMPRKGTLIKKRFVSVNGLSAEMTGDQLVELAKNTSLGSITRDGTFKVSSLSNKQQWPYQSQVSKFWEQITNTGVKAPTIAVVDSGIEAGRADFGGRVIKAVNLSTLAPNAAGDGRGHGTFVAGIAAGAAAGYAGGAPNANIVSIDVMDDQGMARTSEVIAAADWILQNKDVYGIRVANFSLHATNVSSFMYDPLDKAVERLWFAGVVVVAAAGNYGANGLAGGVHYAPGNDPFIITAGAYDGEGTMGAADDVNAPWSAYGYTPDGFSKPDVGAPGRYVVGPVPTGSTLVAEKPANVVASGYMQLSGTSFSAPVVSAAAAYILALRPNFTPDQVKGALMVTAEAPPSLAPRSMGVGEVRAAKAAAQTAPPNPNAALNNYLVSDPNGGSGKVFDAVSWSDAAKANVSWDSASWSDASWSSASWNSASWSDASWSSASWNSVSWSDLGQEAAALESVSWADNAGAEVGPTGGYIVSSTDLLGY